VFIKNKEYQNLLKRLRERMRRVTDPQVFARLRRPKPIHRAHLTAPDGRASAKCFVRPRAIDLSRATWTIRDEDVTCKKCLAISADPCEA